MTLVLKHEFAGLYSKLKPEMKLQYINSTFNPSHDWIILVMSPDGEFYSLRKEHVHRVTKLEEALK